MQYINGVFYKKEWITLLKKSIIASTPGTSGCTCYRQQRARPKASYLFQMSVGLWNPCINKVPKEIVEQEFVSVLVNDPERSVWVKTSVTSRPQNALTKHERFRKKYSWFFGLSGFWTEAQNKESQNWLYSVCWLLKY